MKHYIDKIAVVVLSGFAVVSGLRAGPISADDVGDAETFGHPALYMGVGSGNVTLSTDPCPSPTATPSPPATANNSQCFQLNPQPAQTNFSAPDIARVKLPKKATRNVIYPMLNIFINYQLHNQTGVDQPSGVFRFTASIDVESDALLDPSIIDPNTSLPANGKLTNVFDYPYRDDRRMNVDDRQRMRLDLVRAGNTGLTRQQFHDSFGLTNAQVDALFNSAITLRMNVTGAAKLCTDAFIFGNMRYFGD